MNNTVTTEEVTVEEDNDSNFEAQVAEQSQNQNADDQSNFQTSTGSENQILKPTIQQILKTNNSTHSMHSTVVNGEI